MDIPPQLATAICVTSDFSSISNLFLIVDKPKLVLKYSATDLFNSGLDSITNSLGLKD